MSEKPYKHCPCGEVIDDSQTHCSDECADMPGLKARIRTLEADLARVREELVRAHELAGEENSRAGKLFLKLKVAESALKRAVGILAGTRLVSAGMHIERTSASEVDNAAWEFLNEKQGVMGCLTNDVLRELWERRNNAD